MREIIRFFSLLVVTVQLFTPSAMACRRAIKIESPVNLMGKTWVIPKNAKLVFSDKGSLSNGIVVGNNTLIESHTDKSFFEKDISISGTWANDTIKVSWFDTFCDGINNDLPALKTVSRMITENGGGVILFKKDSDYRVAFSNDPSGGYTEFPSTNSIALDLRHIKKVKVDLNGSTLSMDSCNSTKYAFILLYDCEEYEISNGCLIGDVFSHDYSDVYYLGQKMKSTHEWGTGIIASGSKGTIHDLSISNMTGDGVLVMSSKDGSHTYHCETEIYGLTISYCRRCGIGCGSSKGLRISDCHIHHIGTWDRMKGTAPQDGINLEYEDSVYDVGDINISNCIIEHCTQKTISASNTTPPRPRNLVIESSRFVGSVVQIANVEQCGNKIVRSCVFENAPIHLGRTHVKDCSFSWESSVNYLDETEFINCSFSGSLTDLNKPYGVCFAATTPKPALFKNCSFDNIRGMNDRSAATQGFSGYAFPIVASFYSCQFSNCSFVQGVNRNETQYTFYDSVLKNGCMIFNEAGNPMRFYRTVLDNVDSYITQDGLFEFEKCDIIQDDPNVVNPLLYYGTHAMKKCSVKNTLSITNRMKAFGINRLRVNEK